MGRLTTPGCERFQQAIPGSLNVTLAGAEVNVAVSLAQLGGEASFVTALPQHAVADAVIYSLRSLGVNTQHIVRSPLGRLGLFFLEKGINQRPANVIYDRAGSTVSLLPPDSYDWEAIFADASWFHLSGVTPAISGIAAAVALRAMEEAAGRGLTISFDMNFRSRLWQWEPNLPPRELAARTVRELLPMVNLFIGGPDDASLLAGTPPPETDDDPRIAAARQLTKCFPNISQVAMTVRETLSASHHRLGGMLYNAAGEAAFQAPLKHGTPAPYDMPNLADRLGGGDAFAAGLIFALTTPELADPQTAVHFAAAAACLAHSMEGDFNLSTRAVVEVLMQGGGAGKVNR